MVGVGGLLGPVICPQELSQPYDSSGWVNKPALCSCSGTEVAQCGAYSAGVSPSQELWGRRWLLDGQSIHLCNTDPPYNVKVEPRSNSAIAARLSSFQGTTHHQSMDVAWHPEKSKPTQKKLRAKNCPLANDFVSDDEFDRLLDAWFGKFAAVRFLQAAVISL